MDPSKNMIIKEHRRREEGWLQKGNNELERKELDGEQHARRSSAGSSPVNETVGIIDCLHNQLSYEETFNKTQRAAWRFMRFRLNFGEKRRNCPEPAVLRKGAHSFSAGLQLTRLVGEL